MNPAPRTYTIRVDGHLDDHWSIWFGGLTITRNSDGTDPSLPVWEGDRPPTHVP